MVYASGNFGQISFDIVAIDMTAGGLDSAQANIATASENINGSLMRSARNFFFVARSARLMYQGIKLVFDDTLGVAMTFADNLTNVSQQTGMSTTQIQEWQQAFLDFGVAPTTTSTLLETFTDNLGKTTAAGEKLKATLIDMGVILYDGNGKLLDSSTLLEEVLPKLSAMDDVQQRDALSAKLFGSNYKDAMDAINNGQAVIADANNQTPQISQEDIDNAHQFSIEWGNLNYQLSVTGGDVGFAAINALNQLTTIQKNHPTQSSSEGDWLTWLAAESLSLSFLSKVPIGAGGLLTWLAAESFSSGLPVTPKKGPGLNPINPKGGVGNAPYGPEQTPESAATVKEQAKEAPDALKAQQEEEKEAADALKAQQEEEKERVTDLTDAYKNYVDELKKLQGEQQKLSDLNSDYQEDLANAGRDPTAIRSVMQSYQRNLRSIQEAAGTDASDMNTYATEFNALKAGTPLSSVPGTSQYNQQQATTIGSLTINVASLSKDYPLATMLSDAQLLKQNRIGKGIPTSTG